MKNMLTQFTGNLLSKQQMKAVKGGYGNATGTAECNNGMGSTSTITCSGSSCATEDDDANGNGGYCRCGNDYKSCNPI